MSWPRKQQQSSGDESTNYQAGRDITVSGVTLAEVREIALDVYRANATELRGVAESIAQGRAESITNAYLAKLYDEAPSRLRELTRPDIQIALSEAQKTFVRSGEENLERVLVDLLLHRTNEAQWTLQSLALDAAIECAAKLSEPQRRVVALIFALRHARPATVTTLSEFYSYLEKYVAPLVNDLPSRSTHYQHIVFVAVGSVSGVETPLGSLIRSGAEGLFTRGFAHDAAIPAIFDRARAAHMLMPCLRRPDEAFQVDALAFADVERIAKTRGLDEEITVLQQLALQGWLDDAEVEREAIERVPALVALQRAWRDTELSSLVLTSAGIAIGHAYWAQATGGTTPLSEWLS